MAQAIGQRAAKCINRLSYFIVRGLYFANILLFKEFRIYQILLKDWMDSYSFIDYQFSEQLVKATISIEDKRFYNHYGHDAFSIIRAVLNNLKGNRRQGASTIEQQIVRTIIKKSEQTFKRKYFEITLSGLLFDRFTKSETINIYLNCYEFQPDVIGVISFCEKENYPIDKLTKKDIYEISARFKYPKINKENYIRYLKRVRTIEIINNNT
ncbi:MAG: transglycosylase domain-containing protein [Bacteroidetes bacterium]|nr:transglycosylase domain-containing protein [Bacteroidota bacterium]